MPSAHLFTHLLALLNHSLAPHCSLLSRAPLRSFTRSRAHRKEVLVYEMNAPISNHFNPQCDDSWCAYLLAQSRDQFARLLLSSWNKAKNGVVGWWKRSENLNCFNVRLASDLTYLASSYYTNSRFLQSIHQNYCYFSTVGPILLCDHSFSSCFKVPSLHVLFVSLLMEKMARIIEERGVLSHKKIERSPSPILRAIYRG